MGSGISTRQDPYTSALIEASVKSVTASTLAPTDPVYMVKDLRHSLRCYQHVDKGNIVILLEASIFEVPSIQDPTEWSEVFLAPEAVEYIEKSPASIALLPLLALESRSSNSDTSSRPSSYGMQQGLSAQRASSSPLLTESNSKTPGASISQFPLKEQQHKDIKPLRMDEQDEDLNRGLESDGKHLPSQYSLVADEKRAAAAGVEAQRSASQTALENHRGFDIVLRSHGTMTDDSGAYFFADIDLDRKMDADLSPASPRRVSGENLLAHAVCQYCSDVVTVSVRSRDASLPAASCAKLEAHRDSCVGVRRLLPSLAALDQNLQLQLAGLHRANSVSMKRELTRAMKLFETRTNINNDILLLIRTALKMQPGDMSSGYLTRSSINQNSSQETASLSVQQLPQILNELDVFATQLLHQLASLLSSVQLTIKEAEESKQSDAARRLLGTPERESRRLHVADTHRQEIDQLNGEAEQLLDFVRLLEQIKKYLKTKSMTIKSFLGAHASLNSLIFVGSLSTGAYASVYMVKSASQNAHYSLKVINKKPEDRDQHHRCVVEKKIMEAAMEGSPESFVKLHASFETRRCFFFVMEYCPGGDCLNLLQRNKLIPEAVVRVIVAEVCVGVRWLHAHGIIHRDIKPDNIFITASGHVKLGDFGISTNRLKKIRENPANLPAGRLLQEPSDAIIRRTNSDASERSVTNEFDSRIWNNADNDDEDFSHVPGGSGYPNMASLSLSRQSGTFNSFSYRVATPRDKEDKEAGLKSESTSSVSGDRSFDIRSIMDKTLSERSSVEGSQREEQERESKDSSRAFGHTQETSSGSSGSLCYMRSNSSTLHFTPIGNVHYMSPECIVSSGYDHMVDWWAIGVLTFHLLIGVTPFEDRHNESMSSEEICDLVVKANIVWNNLILTNQEVKELHSSSSFKYKYNFEAFDEPLNSQANQDVSVLLDPATGKSEVRISAACRYFILDMLMERKKDRLGYHNGCGAGPGTGILSLRDDHSDRGIGYSKEFADRAPDSKKKSGRSNNDGILDHEFFSTVNLQNLYKGKGPLVLHLDGEEDRKYCRPSAKKGEPMTAEGVPSFWTDA